jgi:hypothetical protein
MQSEKRNTVRFCQPASESRAALDDLELIRSDNFACSVTVRFGSLANRNGAPSTRASSILSRSCGAIVDDPPFAVALTVVAVVAVVVLLLLLLFSRIARRRRCRCWLSSCWCALRASCSNCANPSPLLPLSLLSLLTTQLQQQQTVNSVFCFN